MYLVTFTDDDHFKYLMHVFHTYVKSGLDPNELGIAGEVWARLKATQKVEIPPDDTIRIPGPLQVVHDGDVRVPVPPDVMGAVE